MIFCEESSRAIFEMGSVELLDSMSMMCSSRVLGYVCLNVWKIYTPRQKCDEPDQASSRRTNGTLLPHVSYHYKS